MTARDRYPLLAHMADNVPGLTSEQLALALDALDRAEADADRLAEFLVVLHGFEAALEAHDEAVAQR